MEQGACTRERERERVIEIKVVIPSMCFKTRLLGYTVYSN